MKVLLTGAAGRLGRQTTQALLNRKHRVIATDRVFRQAPGVDFVVADLTDLDKAFLLVQQADAVVHVGNNPNAAEANLRLTYHNNVLSDANVLHAAAETGVRRIVYASSITTVSGSRRAGDADHGSELAYLPLDGDAPPNPGYAYAAGKLASEQYLKMLCKQRGITGVALRLPYLMTAQQVGHKQHTPLDAPIPGMPLDEGFSYLSYPDAAKLIAACLDAKKITGYRCYLPAAAGNLLGWPKEKILETFYPGVALRGEQPLRAFVDNRRITEETGWTPSEP